MFDTDYTAEEARLRALERLARDQDALVKRLLRQVARLMDDNAQQRPQLGGASGGGWVGQTAAAIGAMSSNKWPGGPVKLGTLALANLTDADPTFIDSGADPVTAYNLTGGVIPANKNVAGIFVGPYRVITTANCKNPTAADPAPAPAPTAGAPLAMTTDNDTFVTDGTQPMMTS